MQVQAGGNSVYTKYMALIDRDACMSYVIRISWTHGELADDIVFNVRKFAKAPPVGPDPMAAILSKLGKLGF